MSIQFPASSGTRISASAGLEVNVYPLGQSRVTYLVSNLGPEQLSRDEALSVLRGVVDLMEREEEADRQGANGIFRKARAQ